VFDATSAYLYDFTVMLDKLPELIDPLLLAERRSVLVGALKLSAFERLADRVEMTDDVVMVDVLFSKQGKHAIVSGTIKTACALVCQSCLEAMPWPIDIAFKLGVVASLEEADRLAVDCEPLLFTGEKVSFSQLIEDEIVLVLPDYPKHSHGCMPRHQSQDKNYHQTQNLTKAENPFSVLATLKKTGE
jgi:uncharacterized protein